MLLLFFIIIIPTTTLRPLMGVTCMARSMCPAAREELSSGLSCPLNRASCPLLSELTLGSSSFQSEISTSFRGSSFCSAGWRDCKIYWAWSEYISTMRMLINPTKLPNLPFPTIQSSGKIEFHWTSWYRTFQLAPFFWQLLKLHKRTWSWQSIHKKISKKYQPSNLSEWNHQNFSPLLIYIVLQLPDSSVNDMSSMIDYPFSSGILGNNLGKLLESRVVTMIPIPQLIDVRLYFSRNLAHQTIYYHRPSTHHITAYNSIILSSISGGMNRKDDPSPIRRFSCKGYCSMPKPSCSPSLCSISILDPRSIHQSEQNHRKGVWGTLQAIHLKIYWNILNFQGLLIMSLIGYFRSACFFCLAKAINFESYLYNILFFFVFLSVPACCNRGRSHLPRNMPKQKELLIFTVFLEGLQIDLLRLLQDWPTCMLGMLHRWKKNVFTPWWTG